MNGFPILHKDGGSRLNFSAALMKLKILGDVCISNIIYTACYRYWSSVRKQRPNVNGGVTLHQSVTFEPCDQISWWMWGDFQCPTFVGYTYLKRHSHWNELHSFAKFTNANNYLPSFMQWRLKQTIFAISRTELVNERKLCL